MQPPKRKQSKPKALGGFQQRTPAQHSRPVAQRWAHPRREPNSTVKHEYRWGSRLLPAHCACPWSSRCKPDSLYIRVGRSFGASTNVHLVRGRCREQNAPPDATAETLSPNALDMRGRLQALKARARCEYALCMSLLSTSLVTCLQPVARSPLPCLFSSRRAAQTTPQRQDLPVDWRAGSGRCVCRKGVIK